MGGRKTRAVTLMLLSSLSFSIMQVFVKMSSTEVGTFEQVFFRNLISMIIAGVTVYRAKLDLIPEIKKGGLALWGRSFFGFLGIVLFFYATGHARQADVAMLNRASPVFVTIFAGPILKEKVSKVQVCAVALCLVGAYISMQPSFDSNPLPLLCALGAAMVAGLAYTLLSYTKRFTSAPVIIFHFSLLSTVCAGLLMIPGFVLPSPKVMGMLLMVGLFAAGVNMPTNSGQAAVRRHGVQLCSGEFIIHCDSDDWVEPQMYEEMYSFAKLKSVSDFETEAENAVVFEDAFYAALNAAKARITVVGISDPSEPYGEEMKNLCSRYVSDFSELL